MVLASHNGKIKNIIIPKEYNKYLIDEFWLQKTGYDVTHYDTEAIGFLFFMFHSQEEMYRVLIDEYRNDLIVMEDSENE